MNILAGSIEAKISETYAQCGEDAIVESLLLAHCLRAQKTMREIRYFEIGANHPIHTSATYLFYRLYQASGVLCEANPNLAEMLSRHRPRDIVVSASISASHDEKATLHVARAPELSSLDLGHLQKFQSSFGEKADVVDERDVENIHINDLMNRHWGPGIDFLSVDIEGLDYDVLRAMDMSRFRPAFIQLEHNSEPQRFCELLGMRDYVCLCITEVNQIFMDWRSISAVEAAAR